MRTVVDCFGFSLAKKRADGSNEDYFEVQPVRGSSNTDWTDFAAIVADGVGSSGAPSAASRAAVESWMLHSRAKFVENAGRCSAFGELHFNEMTSHAYLQAHEATSQSRGSACAASVCVQGDQLFAGNVGDCRIYRISPKGVEQISQDQVDSQGDPTQVIGGRRTPEAHTTAARVQAGDVIVLCSDGVWKLIGADELRKAAMGSSAREIAQRLRGVLENVRRPESDDATAVVALIVKTGKPFWEADSKDMNPGIKDDPTETKLNAVLAELLNRLRAPLEKESTRAEQVLDQLNSSVRDLKAQVRALDEVVSDAGSKRSGRPRAGYVPIWSLMASVAGAMLVTGLVSWALLGRPVELKSYELKPRLPKDAKVISQQYTNDALQVKYVNAKGKPALAIYKPENGGRPSVIIDLSTNKPQPDTQPAGETTREP